MRTLLGLIALAAGLIGIVALVERPPEPAAVPGGSATVAPAAEAPAVAPAPRLAATVGSPRAARATAPADAPAGATTPAALEQDLAARLAGEADDPAWAAQTEERIARAVAGFAGSRVRAADCRATVCKVELEHDDPEAQEQLLERLTFTPPFDTRGYVRPSAPGQPSSTLVYLARAGHRLSGS